MNQDAESLYRAGRYGTADHLFGLAAECALKVLLLQQSQQRDAGKPVHLPQLWEEYSRAATGRGSKAVPQRNPFSGWSINDRYAEDETFRTGGRTARYRNAAGQIFALLQSQLPPKPAASQPEPEKRETL